MTDEKTSFALYEARKKLVLKAIEDVKDLIPIAYVLSCPDETQWIKLVIKFKDEAKSTIYVTDLHDYIYTKYFTDPKIFLVNRLSPKVKEEMLKTCEFIYGEKEEMIKDLEKVEEEAKRFLEHLAEIRRFYTEGTKDNR